MVEDSPSERWKIRLWTWQYHENIKLPFGSQGSGLINGAHIVIYTKDPESDRAFFRDVLKFSSVDAGHGWLIFAMPPLEAAFHDSENNDQHELYLMCDEIVETLKNLKSKNVTVSDVSERPWGKVATFTLPGGGKIGVYEPKHPSPLGLKR
jgi:catechol 2,3-dioxygenase-like lactoylglutathione lyase family enzyme